MTKNITIDVAANQEAVELTRVYKVSGNKTVKTQPITVNLAEVAMVRPSNRLGKAKHRATITLNSGSEVEIAETYSSVSDMVLSFADAA